MGSKKSVLHLISLIREESHFRKFNEISSKVPVTNTESHTHPKSKGNWGSGFLASPPRRRKEE